jgi:hypothetical protein
MCAPCDRLQRLPRARARVAAKVRRDMQPRAPLSAPPVGAALGAARAPPGCSALSLSSHGCYLLVPQRAGSLSAVHVKT